MKVRPPGGLIEVLAELEVADKLILTVLNKIDAIEDEQFLEDALNNFPFSNFWKSFLIFLKTFVLNFLS